MTALRAALLLFVCAQAACLDAPPSAADPTGLHSVQFFGNAFQDNGVDRVWIVAERPSPVGRLGNADLTLELWLKTEASDVGMLDVCPAQWWQGTIVVDREFYEEPPQNGNVGISIFRTAAGSGVAVGFEVADVGELNLCGDAEIADGGWHHIAMTRDSANVISLWVDGQLDEAAVGPAGDGSFADDLVGPLDEGDRFLVVGGPKQAGTGRGFVGLVDELRLSHNDLYQADFDPPYPPLSWDDSTLALYRFDEESGTDIPNATDGAGNGELRVGGTPVGPVWSDDVPVSL